MANVRISQLPQPQTALTGLELVPVVQTGQTVQTTVGAITALVNFNGLIYQGTWNASTNIPILTSSIGTQGYFYQVSTAGSTNLNGVTNWNVGDWAVFLGGVWTRLANFDAGGVLTVPDGGTGLSSLAGGSLTYGNGTNPFNTLAIGTAGQVLTVNSGATAPQWVSLSTLGVTSFSAGTTGLTPSTATTGAITLGGTLAASNGGTGLSALLATGSLTYGSGTNAFNTLAIGAANQVLTVNSGATAPQWVSLSTLGVTSFSAGTTGLTPSTATAGAVTLAGTLVVSNGGTGLTSLTTGYIPYGNGTSALSSLSTFNFNGTTLSTPTLGITSVTSTTPALSFNASNTNLASGASVSGSYLQSVFQNSSATAGASVNYVLSNNLGTDSSYYGEFGMNSSVFSASTPSDFFSINNGIYFSGHDGDVTFGSENGFKTYFAWGTAGQSAHVINASGALGFSTNLGTTPALSGTTGYGTSGQALISAGSAAAPAWGTLGVTAGGTGTTGTPTNGQLLIGNGTNYTVASLAVSNGLTATTGSGTLSIGQSNAGGKINSTAISGSLTPATGGITLSSQTAASNSTWRVVAYGTYASASSTTVRQFISQCYWGSTALNSISLGTVLVSVAQTTSWRVEFILTGNGATGISVAGFGSSQVSSATIPLSYSLAPGSGPAVSAGAQTIDVRFGQTGLAVAGDTITVYSVTIERIV